MNETKLVTVPEAAKVLGLAPSTLYEGIAEGRLTAGVYRIGRSVRIDLPTLLNALAVGGYR